MNGPMLFLEKNMELISFKHTIKEISFSHLILSGKLLASKVEVLKSTLSRLVNKRKAELFKNFAALVEKTEKYNLGLSILERCSKAKHRENFVILAFQTLKSKSNQLNEDKKLAQSQLAIFRANLDAISSNLTDLRARFAKNSSELIEKETTINSLISSLNSARIENNGLSDTLNEIVYSSEILKKEFENSISLNSKLNALKTDLLAEFESLQTKYNKNRQKRRNEKQSNQELKAEVVSLGETVSRGQQLVCQFEKEITSLNMTLKSKENDFKRMETQNGDMKAKIKELEADILKSKHNHKNNEESRTRVLQCKVERLFEENEALRSELRNREHQVDESQKIFTQAKTVHSNELDDLKNTVHRLNKEKIDFFKDMTLLNDKYQVAIREKEKMTKISKGLENKVEEYESQMQNYKEIIEKITSKESDSYLYSAKEKANLGQISFVSGKSDREKFSILAEKEQGLGESTEDILQRVTKIREKYEKKNF